MKQTKLMMDMPITVEIIDEVSQDIFDEVFEYFKYVDQKFSVFKTESEISQINRGELRVSEYSLDMIEIFNLASDTKKKSNGFFDIRKPNGSLDPSGLVKGWAICNSAKILDSNEIRNFYIDAGGDIECRGLNSQGNSWRVGIRNPFNRYENIKIVYLKDRGIATSGTYIRGLHVYNPKSKMPVDEIISLTVIGPNAYEADRFATAAFAQGKEGIMFIEKLQGLEGYMIDKEGFGTATSGFNKYMTEV